MQADVVLFKLDTYLLDGSDKALNYHEHTAIEAIDQPVLQI